MSNVLISSPKDVLLPSSMKSVSSAHCQIRYSLLCTEIPLIFLFLRTSAERISTQRRNIYGDRGSPCLHTLCISKDEDIFPLTITLDLIFL